MREVSSTHALIGGARLHFESGRPTEEGAYLKPYKKLLVDITASKPGLLKALTFANDLFKALESAGHRVVLASASERFSRIDIDQHEVARKEPGYTYPSLWRPSRKTVVYVGSTPIGLAVVEMSESVVMRYVNGKYIRDSDYVPPKRSRYVADHTWTSTQDRPCGRLRLIAYSPYWYVSWSRPWQETRESSLTDEIPTIIKALESAVPVLVDKKAEADRQAEIRRLEWLAEEERERQRNDRKQVAQAIKDSRTQLAGIIQAWADAMNVERFLQGVEDRVAKLPDHDRASIVDRLRLAREYVGNDEPLKYFLNWKTPLERYQPIYPHSSEPDVEAEAED